MSNGKLLLEICGNKFKVRPGSIVLAFSLVNIQLLMFVEGISRFEVFPGECE